MMRTAMLLGLAGLHNGLGLLALERSETTGNVDWTATPRPGAAC